jgi:hypothetical protein
MRLIGRPAENAYLPSCFPRILGQGATGVNQGTSTSTMCTGTPRRPHAHAGRGTRDLFGPFQVDPRTRELRKSRTRVRVPAQSIRILLALLDRAGDVVTRDELAAILWTGETGVDIEHGLNSAVRHAQAGDSSSWPHAFAGAWLTIRE